MPFPFTFSIAVPGLNPFSTPVETPSGPHSTPDPSQSPEKPRARPARPHNVNEKRPRPSPSPSPSAPVSRKRGWDPSLAEPSQSSATFASSSGYLDTPAKYRETAGNQPRDEFELEDMSASIPDLPPPAKRRRGLAGSIISSAVGAAMISAAVGLTVYRLWRDHGKEPQPEALQPPPPYQQGEWTPDQPPHAVEATPPTPMTATPRHRKARHGSAVATSRRHHQRVRPRVHARAFSPPSAMSPSKPIFNPETKEADDSAVVEDQMDWMGEQLSMLIQEGQKALGREIVIQSDSREDEIDDGNGAWEEEEATYNDHEFGVAGPSTHRGSLSRSASPRRIKQPRNLTLAPPSYTSRTPSASPRNTRFELVSSSLPSSAGARWRPDAADRDMTAEFGGRSSSAAREEKWESPELKESMARARARLLGARGAG